MSKESFESMLRASHDFSAAELLGAAKKSELMFIRSIDQLAEDSPRAKGHRLTAYEALDSYGKDILLETVSEGSALLADSASAVGRVLKGRRELLGLTVKQVASRAGVISQIIEDAERSKRLPIAVYEQIAEILGLDERRISFDPEPIGNDRIAYRLRTLSEELPPMTPSAVSTISEAAWVAATQLRLEEELGLSYPQGVNEPSSNYGSPGYPAYLQGYFLATETRQKLGLNGDPIPSLREVCEDTLGIPLIQAELGEHIAGVTLRVGKRRAIVLNIGGANRHVYQRRTTIAHELGHILHDVDEKLNDLRVDDYADLERPIEAVTDRVEQRANAFSVEFIAPRSTIVELYQRTPIDPIGAIMNKFGISLTAVKYHLQNGLDAPLPPEHLYTRHYVPNPAFEAAEAYTADFHPIRGIPILRRGSFSGIVLRATEERIISWSTAAQYLQCSEDDLRVASEDIRSLFPTVFDR